MIPGILKKYTLLFFLVPAVFWTYSTVFTSSRLPGGELSDTTAQGYPFLKFTEESIRNGDLPHWNPYIFCGIPFYSSFSAPIFYLPRGLLLLAAGTGAVVRFIFPMHMFLGGIFAWLFMRSMGVGKWGSIVGSLAFATTAWSNTLFYAGHGSKIICWSYLPLLLYSSEMWMKTGRYRYPAYGGLALGMQALASHPQMFIYSTTAATIWMGFRAFTTGGAISRNATRAVIGILSAVLLGIAVGAVQLLPGYHFSGYSTRGDDLPLETAQSYSLPPEESLTMLFPHLFGYRHGFPDSTVSGLPTYFGRLGLRLSSEFVGVIFFILAAAAFTGAPKKYRLPLAAMCLTGLVVSWGGYTPIFGLLYKAIPIMRKLRAPHMAAFLTTSALALSAGPGFDALFRDEDFPRKRFIRVILGFAGICLLLFLFSDTLLPGLQSGWWNLAGHPGAGGFRALVNRRVDMAAPDFVKAAAAALVLAGIVHLHSRRRISLTLAGTAVAILAALETIPVNRNFQFFLHETSVERILEVPSDLKDMVGDGRLLPGGNRFSAAGIMSVSGYHAAKPEVTRDLQNMISAGGVTSYGQTAFTVLQTRQGYLPYDDFRTLVLEEAASESPSMADTLAELLPLHPLPRTFFASSWTKLSGEECMKLLAAGLDPRETTVLYENPDLPSNLDTGAAIAEIVVDEPCNVVIETVNPSEGILVLADTWYPRWKVLVDGNPGKILRANHWQRAVRLSPGEHTVSFLFDSGDVTVGFFISLAGLMAAASAILADVLYARKKKAG